MEKKKLLNHIEINLPLVKFDSICNFFQVFRFVYKMSSPGRKVLTKELSVFITAELNSVGIKLLLR